MSTLSAQEVLKLALDAGFNRADADVMVVIAKYESAWDPRNVSDLQYAHYGSIGLWQCFTGAHSPAELHLGHGAWTPTLVDLLKDPVRNAEAARIIFKEQGFSAWSTWKHYRGTYAWAKLLHSVQAIGKPAPAPAPAAPAVNARGQLALQRAAADTHTVDMARHDKCLRVVREWLGVPALAARAIDAWNDAGGARGKYTHTVKPAPAGVPVFFSPNHIVLSAGRGMCFSTDIHGPGTVALVPFREIERRWGMRYLGWSETLNGVRVYGEPS